MKEDKPYRIIATVAPLEFWLCVVVVLLVVALAVVVVSP